MHLRSLGNAPQLSAAAAVSFIFTTLNFRGFLNTTRCKCHPGTLPNSSHLWCSALFILLFLYPPPKKRRNPEPMSCPIGPTLLCPEMEIIKIVTRFFELVGGIWCGERSIIYGVFDLASCLSCLSMSSLHISGLCSACISLMAMYTHTHAHMQAHFLRLLALTLGFRVLHSQHFW